ncbi:response regulator [Oceanicaulis sp.]|uniref:response regulator n=1 Tax=Oceanicaulis sp. TaxID=1924941 RepID=UPI003F72DDBF
MTRSVLFVDDDAVDRMFLEMSLKESGLDIDATYCENGVEAMKSLREKTPDLVVTDLSMPEMSGIELTQALKSDDAYNSIPVLMLSTSNNKSDVRDFYSTFGNAYIRKPESIEGYERVIKEISRFWFGLVVHAVQ